LHLALCLNLAASEAPPLLSMATPQKSTGVEISVLPNWRINRNQSARGAINTD
jgi:hypothetical protein